MLSLARWGRRWRGVVRNNVDQSRVAISGLGNVDWFGRWVFWYSWFDCKNVFNVIGTHPFAFSGRYGSHRRIQAIHVPMQRAIVA